MSTIFDGEPVQVQQEDIALCEAVQRGLRSPAYDSGRCKHRFDQLQLAALCLKAQHLLCFAGVGQTLQGLSVAMWPRSGLGCVVLRKPSHVPDL